MPKPKLKIVVSQPSEIRAADWINLERQIDKLPSDWQRGEILNLEGFKTLKYKEINSDVIILAEMQITASCQCSDYQIDLKKNGWTKHKMILDSPIRCKRTSIYFRAQRYYCTTCLKSVQQNIPVIHGDHYLTVRLVEYVKKQSFSIYKNFTDVSKETGVSEKVIRVIFTKHGIELEKSRIIITPSWIAIDEICPSIRKYMRCAITSPLERKVMDLLEDNNRETLLKWLLQLPDRSKIEVVTIDMSRFYKSVIKQALPNAAIVVDRYHVHNLLNVAIKEVLDVIRKSLTKKQQDDWMRPEHLLLKSRFSLSSNEPVAGNTKLNSAAEELSEQKVVNQWFQDMPDIARAYTLKEDFSDILQLTDRLIAEQRTEIWLEQVASFSDHFSSKYQRQCKKLDKYPFQNVLKTMKEWSPFILNYIDFKNRFDIKVTNAFAEYANRIIKEAHRKGNGYSFEVLRLKILYGDFIKECLPEHPIKPKRKVSATYSGQEEPNEKSSENLSSNIANIRKMRQDKDQTKDLLPNPQENDDWRERFEAFTDASETVQGQFEHKENSKPDEAIKSLKKAVKKKRKIKTDNSSPDQPSLF